MALSIKDPERIEALHPNILLYGPPKTGKTAGAATAPGNILFLNGDLPNATRYARRKARGRFYEVDVVPFNRDTPNHTPMEDALTDIYTTVLKQAQAGNDDLHIDTVVVDPIGEVYRRLLEEGSKRAISPSLPTYQAAGVILERWCRSMCELPINFVIVGHELSTENEAEQMVDKHVLASTKSGSEHLSNKLMGMVDVIGYTAILETEDSGRQYVAQLITEKGRKGGERWGGILGDYRAINLAEWIDLMAQAEKADAEQDTAPEAPKTETKTKTSARSKA